MAMRRGRSVLVVVGLVAICSLLYVVIEQSVTVHYLEVGALHDRNEDPPDVDGVWNPPGTPARATLLDECGLPRRELMTSAGRPGATELATR